MGMKTLAIVAHDGKKDEVIAFARRHRELLTRYHLLATRSTGTLLKGDLDLEVETVLSGPLGGDAQIAARVVVGEVAMVFFIVDPLDKHPHDPDIQTLLRACNVHDIPLASNLATAERLLLADD
jgi:methylglyoxal synthase